MPAQPSLILFIALSLDGRIADGRGSVDWLEGFEDSLADFPDFFASIGSLLMGRATLDFIRSHPWPYEDRPLYALSRSDLAPPPPQWPPIPITTVRGSPGEVLSTIRADMHARGDTRDIWLVGGAGAAGPFLAEGLVDAMRLTVIPVTLGGGPRLWPDGVSGRFTLRGVRHFPSGAAELRYTASR